MQDAEGNALLPMTQIKNEITRQSTTFDLANKNKTIMIPRGTSRVAAEAEGEGYISQLWITFTGWFWRSWDPGQPVNQSVLKTLVLKLTWDGAEYPAIYAPAGDFFGNGLGQMTSFCSKYFGMSSGGFYCKLPMPFRKGFRLEIENRDPALDVEVFVNLVYQLTVVSPDSGYLHAQFRTGRNEGPDSLVIAEARGRGHFAGCCLSMQGRDRNYLSFLEAPEYVYIDQPADRSEVAPAIVGTGLEDYFLGGWYFREGPFIGSLHGVPIKDALNSAVAMYRMHELDAFRFRDNFSFHFVNPWNPERLLPFAYSSVAFLYLDKPEGEDRTMPPAEELWNWYRVKDTDHQSIP